MKIALLTDTHWGVRNDSIPFHDNTKRYLDELFFPYLDKHNIKTLIHLGDLCDRRKYVNFYTAKRLRTDFLEPLQERGISSHFIVGNHDSFYKNTNQINCHSELIDKKFTNCSIYPDPQEIEFDGLKMLFVPWICNDNRDQTIKLLSTSKAPIVMGHLELQGFQMYKGSVVSHGDDPSLFDRFDLVLSGHYHHRSTTKNIHYLGNPAEFTWSDFGDQKGFHIFDTATRELEFVPNPYTMFRKVWYKDADQTLDAILNVDFSVYKDKILKIIVQSKDNPFWFDQFIDTIEKQNPIEIQIVDDHHHLDSVDDSDIISEAESTVNIFERFIDQMNMVNDNKTKLRQLINELYQEALQNE
jgi:DNA repair exonuclease SbcCD nuclease subunit